MKRCSSCKQDKPRSEFGSNKKKRDGLNNECKGCATANQQLRRAKRKKRKIVEETKIPTDNLVSKFESDLESAWKQVKENAANKTLFQLWTELSNLMTASLLSPASSDSEQDEQ